MAKEDFRADTVNIDIMTVNRQSISVYRKHIIGITVTDTNNMTKSFNIPFIVTDIKHYKIILDYL